MNSACYSRAILYRKAQGKKRLAGYKHKIELLLHSDFDPARLLRLPETDKLISELQARNESSCEPLEFASAAASLDFASSRMADRRVYLLIDDDWKYCGAYRLESARSLCTGFDFDQAKSDEVRLISSDFCAQLSIDYSEDRGVGIFECCLRTYEST